MLHISFTIEKPSVYIYTYLHFDYQAVNLFISACIHLGLELYCYVTVLSSMSFYVLVSF